MMTKEQQKMVVENLETARTIACVVRRPHWIQWEEWLSDAEFALCLAVVQFSPDKGSLFGLASVILKRLRNRIVIGCAVRSARIGRRFSMKDADGERPYADPAKQAEVGDLIARAFGELSSRDREVLVMSASGATGQEIAQRLGVSGNQGFVAVYRARKRARLAVPEAMEV